MLCNVYADAAFIADVCSMVATVCMYIVQPLVFHSDATVFMSGLCILYKVYICDYTAQKLDMYVPLQRLEL